VSHKKPVLPVVEVDQAFPLLTTEGSVGGGAPSSGADDQTPTVTKVIRDVLGWRPRRQDTKAFTAALDASFELKTVEGHIESRYVPRGYAVQADLGGVTGGQASLYTRAKTSHIEITRILDALKPLRPDHDPEDCEAYRALVRDSVRQIVNELGMPGGPRVELVDSAFTLLTGHQFGGQPGFSIGPPTRVGAAHPQAGQGLVPPGSTQLPLALPGTTVDDIPGQLGAMRDRFGLTDDNVNTVEEEQVRTAFLTLVDLIVDLQRSWEQQRVAFGDDVGRGFLGTELVLINRLMAAAAEQVDELEAVLESALVSSAERQTIVLDTRTRLTLDGLLGWMRSFLAEDGPRIARDTGRDGLTTSFTPTVLALLQTLRSTLVARLVPCGSSSCGGLGGCRCSHKGVVAYLPLGCCSPLPPGMYAGRTKIAVSGLCGLLERLARAAARIGRFSGAVLLDVVVTPFDDLDQQLSNPPIPSTFVRVEVRGLHLRPSYLPAFVLGGSGRRLEDLVLPVRGSASADADSVVGVFDSSSLPAALQPGNLGEGAVFAAGEIPLALVDGETGRIVTAPPVTTWPDLRPASTPGDTSGPGDWTQPQDQRWVPQRTDPSPLEEEEVCIDTDDCTEPCQRECDKKCGDQCGCDCGCHLGPKLAAALEGASKYLGDPRVTEAAANLFKNLGAPRLAGAAGGVGHGQARVVQERGSDLRQTLHDLSEALKDAGRSATAERRTGVPRRVGREPDLRPARERVDSIRAARDRAAQELATARQQFREAEVLAKRHHEEAESVAATARDTTDLATTLKQFAIEREQEAAEAARRQRAAEQEHAELERELNITELVARKEQDVSEEEVTPVEEPPVVERPWEERPWEERPWEERPWEEGPTAPAEPVGEDAAPVAVPERVEPTLGNMARWLKEEGDRVEVGEPVAELSTDSGDIQVRAPVAGLLRSRAVQAGQAVRVGTELAVIELDDSTTDVLVATVVFDLRGTAEQQLEPAEEEQAPPVEAEVEQAPPAEAEEAEQPAEVKEKAGEDEAESGTATPDEPEPASQEAAPTAEKAAEATAEADKAATKPARARKKRTGKSSGSGSRPAGKRTTRSKDK
jgi:biotin carboxyl carrier protein